MKTSLHISRDGKETGALLQQYLTDRGVYDRNSDAVVFYGRGHSDGPNLNGNRLGQDKIDNMRIMTEAGVRVVPYFSADDRVPQDIRFPLLARKAHGMGGTDIATVFQRQEIDWRKMAGWDWFSSYVPIANEYRVWIFRGQHLDTYEKTMQRPTDYKYIGRNFRNGFDFTLSRLHRDAADEAGKAVRALKLDFGAVDLLRGEDGRIYILEVNTAPGVIKSGAQATLGKLADCITNWCDNGYPTQ